MTANLPAIAVPTVQLHIDPELAGEHRLRVYHYAGAAEAGKERYVGALQVPPWLVQQLVQLTPLLEKLIGDQCHLAWTGALPPAKAPDPVLEKLGKVLRTMRRVFAGKAAT